MGLIRVTISPLGAPVGDCKVKIEVDPDLTQDKANTRNLRYLPIELVGERSHVPAFIDVSELDDDEMESLHHQGAALAAFEKAEKIAELKKRREALVLRLKELEAKNADFTARLPR